jgi:cytidylate kinase
MPIITISRGSLSGGQRLAEGVARLLNYECVSREFLVEAPGQYGVDARRLEEAVLRPPTFWERLAHQRQLYMKIVRAALLEKVKSGRLVYHGMAGHLLLQDVPCVLRVRVIAPLDRRIEAAMAAQGLSHEQALHHIHKVDEMRVRWTKYLYNVEWGDPALFDLVVNLEQIRLETAVDMIAALAQREEFDCGPQCREQLEGLALAARVEAALEFTPETRGVEVQAYMEKGTLHLIGKIETEPLRRKVQSVVKEAVNDPRVPIVDQTSVNPASRYPA